MAVLGLIAGQGRFPIEVARRARARGREVVAIAFPSETLPELEAEADHFEWVELGALSRTLDVLHAGGVREAVMAGKVSKTHLYESVRTIQLDPRSIQMLASLADQKDHSILGAIANLLADEGITLLRQPDMAPDLFAGPGPIGSLDLDPKQRSEVAFGWPLAKAVANLDIGQTIVVCDRAVMAVEAIEGTDDAIRRGGALAGGGAVAVKVCRDDQDLRFDLPGLGLDTLASLVAVKASALVFEAGRTVVLDGEELAREADAAGVALVGIPAEGPGG